MIKMKTLTQEKILRNLKTRYNQNLIYVRTALLTVSAASHAKFSLPPSRQIRVLFLCQLIHLRGCQYTRQRRSNFILASRSSLLNSVHHPTSLPLLKPATTICARMRRASPLLSGTDDGLFFVKRGCFILNHLGSLPIVESLALVRQKRQSLSYSSLQPERANIQR